MCPMIANDIERRAHGSKEWRLVPEACVGDGAPFNPKQTVLNFMKMYEPDFFRGEVVSLTFARYRIVQKGS